ncbi:putative metalloprotease CJM1_0395 family protein [Hydrogenophaga atypica]|uniref:Metalloprotease CJM1_0395 family protein n=1 Tax=Hydrogenophaga atypica TaxID=249409 RepID=A0ABW2QHM9_9BURK
MNIGNATATPYPGNTAGQAQARAAQAGTQQLTEAELKRVAELKATDAKVRAHEMAHMAAGQGVVTSGPSYTYAYGPDGRAYAVGGEVGVDTAPEQSPQANIDKGRRIQAAALAPAEPSGQDLRVAAAGRALQAEGVRELARLQRDAVTSETPRLSVWA